jgi:hypothetical protein
MESVPITTNVVSSNPLDTTLFDKVVSVLRQVSGFSLGTPVSSTNKADRHCITEKLSKVASNTITLTLLIKVFVNNYFTLLI